MRSTAAEWTKRVRVWSESGRTAEEFAQGKGYTGRLLRGWAGEFKRRSRRTPTVKMARVVAKPPEGRMTLVVSGASLVVERGFDAELLRNIVLALAETR